MYNLENPILWVCVGLFIMFFILIVFLVILSNRKKAEKEIIPNKNVTVNVTNNEINSELTDIDDETIVDDNTEEFGMYTGALSNWLERNTVNLDKYTNKQKYINSLHSLNNAIEITESDYIPYDTSRRFSTPTFYMPKDNPQFNYNIRG
jgi:hypothetical protein